MNKTIKISKELEIPLMDYATQATALMGIKGAGKSMSGGFLAEQLMTEGIEELCARAGIAVGSFDTYMRKLKTLELAEKNGNGVRASAELFE